MKFYLFFLAGIFCMSSCNSPESSNTVNASTKMTTEKKADYALVIHGGAGTILKKNITPEKETAIREVLNKALDTGEAILKAGGSSMDAIEKTIMILENSPFFNAGKGAVFTNAGRNELDASFMDGKTQRAGAVGGITNVRNPILAARAVMEQSKHVLLTGKGAEEFAEEVGLELVDPDYFYTERRWKAMERAKAKEKATGMIQTPQDDNKFGTVGAAALDKNGNLAAGTSTGGMTNKRYNRLGDSPIIGAGTYANNKTCAVSCTGHGEYFIRYAVAYDVSAMMEYKGEDFQKAADYIIKEKLKNNGGSGGFIGVDYLGNVAMPFNTAGMYRGFAKPGEREVKIYEE